MAQYSDVNTGIIGSNGFKKDPKHPDVRGRINVDGIWYWVSGWNKQANGNEFTSLALTIMTQEQVDEMMRKREEKAKAKAQPQAAAQQQQPRQQPTQQQQAPAQQQAPQSSAYNPNEPQDFDSDIPFAPIGLQEGRRYLHCI